MKARTKKTLRKVSISALVMLSVFILAGVLYTWTMGKIRPFESTLEQPAPVKNSAPAIIEPTKPAENTPVGVALQSVTTPIAPGSNVTLIVKTKADATCKINVVYGDITSKDSGLMDRKADEFGTVSWTWTVEATVPVGKWPATVTCSRGDKSGVYVADLVVKK